MICASPRYSVSVPMVTMIEGSCRRMISSALNAPISSPATSPTAMASGIDPVAWKVQAKRQAESAMLAAGDRSISPAMITMVSTRATIENSA